MSLMNKFLPLCFIAMIFVLSGCVSHYSIFENDISHYLDKKLTFTIKQGNEFLGAELILNHVQIKLGQLPNKITIIGHSHIKITNPFVPFKASLLAEFSATPWYDKKNHSVYLKDLKLIKIESAPKNIAYAINDVSPQLVQHLRKYFENNPIYQLTTDDIRQALLAKITEQIKVEPGKLVLVFK